MSEMGILLPQFRVSSNRYPRLSTTAADGRSSRHPISSSPIQQLTGQVRSQDNQYQCGHPLLQLGIVAAMPIASPTTKNQSTCCADRLGAKRAQSHAQRIEMTTKKAVLAMSAELDGVRPLTKSPGNRRESSGSVATTRTTEST
jgi:hypothetical protein